MSLLKLKKELTNYHQDKASQIFNRQSPMVGNQFPGEFNVSAYHQEVQHLVDKPGSFWGIDRCLRLQEEVDETHSNIFHMGVFAKGLDLKENLIDPFKDKRFDKLKKEIIINFINLITILGIQPKKLEATYLDALTFGGNSVLGRDRLLQRQYQFPQDKISKNILTENKITSYPVKSIANLDIHPLEGSLVGPRLEVAYQGIELATIVFDCFKIQNGKLMPINYVAGYALGIERLYLIINHKHDLISALPRYQKATQMLRKLLPVFNSSFYNQELRSLVFAGEAFHALDKVKKLNKGQKDILRKFRKKVMIIMSELNLNEAILKTLNYGG